LQARVGLLLTLVIVTWFLSSGASSHPPGIGYLDFPVTAQDEAVYSHAAIAMAESGDWSTPTFLGRFFLYKPPLLYWLSGLSIELFGVSAWALRLPSILAAAFTAGLVFVWVLGASNWWRATLAVIFLATCPLFLELGRRNMTDALITAVIVATAWLLARRKPLDALAACIAVGVLCKSIAGLIPIMIAGLWWLLAATERPPLRRLVLVSSLGLLIAAPWFVYQWETHRRWFEAEFVGVELLAYGASAPPQTSAESTVPFYATRLFANSPYLCSLTLLAIPGILAGIRRSRQPELIALLTSIAVMTAAILAYQYHNATYLLPLLPLLAIAGVSYAPAWGLAASGLAWVWFMGGHVGRVEKAPPRAPAVVRLAEEYCQMQRGNELIVVGIDDDFSISTLPLAKLRYAIQGAARNQGQVTLDFRRMGIIQSVADFNPGQGQGRYSAELRNWGLQNDDALGTVIAWERPEELAELVKANPDRDFLFPKGEPPSAETHRTVTGNGGARLLLSHRALPRAKPLGRACRL
jgi:hypothetical protein